MSLISMEQFVPPTTITILFCTFSILRFENQRWVRTIGAGRQGSNPLMTFFATATGFLALLFGIAAIGFVFWNAGWQIGLGIMLISFLAGTIASLVIGDSFFVQLLATLGLWPLSYFIIQEILILFPV